MCKITTLRGIAYLVLLTIGITSCLKEQEIPIDSVFSILMSEDKISPLSIELKNESYGADEYEWTFEGGTPSSSKEKNPGKVVFHHAGTHKVSLRVWNAVSARISEQTIRVDSAMTIDFDFSIAINDIAPAKVSITNRSKGGNTYEWSFDGGDLGTSDLQHPVPITFTHGGEHSICLKVFNGSKYEELKKTFHLQAPMQADFSYAPLAIDQDWEAPLTLTTTNLTTGALSYHWQCDRAQVFSEDAPTTQIRFERAGTYLLRMTASNGKEEKTVEKRITIKSNRGIIQHKDLKFGINEAKNSIGCFYSSQRGGVLTSDQITQGGYGKNVDFGFFALNSSFNYCYFFAPNQAKNSSFPAIAEALGATFINTPRAMNIHIDDATFEHISQPSDLNQFTAWSEPSPTSFSKLSTPHFVLVRTTDGRRGIIRVREYVVDGIRSHIIADVKMEKKEGE